jgi:hypothetical protein
MRKYNFSQEQHDIIVNLYREYGIPADSLVIDPERMRDFHLDYVHQSNHGVTMKELCGYLLNQRKLGEEKGGLPKLCRQYNGRKVSA